jgi:16S rRNA (cytosine1402-N4)-methyltransferase
VSTPVDSTADPSTEPDVHVPILVDTVLEHLAVRPGGRYVDATVNGGGHTRAILAASAPDGQVLALDRDEQLIARLRESMAEAIESGRLHPVHSSFAALLEIAAERGFAEVDGVLFDLGLSSFHLDRSGRGFSFAREEPLDMRFDPGELPSRSARELIARAPAGELTAILRDYGEERFASRIARSIVARREREPIETTADLLAVIESSLPANTRWRAARHAARIFQGLRIAVNEELDAVREALPQAWQCLVPGGRMVVLSFHSLEDRIVKRYFRDLRQHDQATVLTKKPLLPSETEIEQNPRAASAKLRAIEKLREPGAGNRERRSH